MGNGLVKWPAFTIVGRFVFGRWNHADLAVESPVIEPFDVIERRPFDVFDVAPRTLAVDEFGLVKTVE